MMTPAWSRRYPKEQFTPESCSISTVGLHYEFANVSSAASFYHSCRIKGNRGIVLDGTQVIDTRYCRLQSDSF